MASQKNKTHNTRDDLITIMDGSKRRIWATGQVHEIYQALKEVGTDEYGSLETAFDRWVKGHKVTSKQLRNEGRHPVRGRKILVQAFKGGDFRFYGAFTTINGKQTFIIVNVVEKKQNKANQRDLKLSAQRFLDCLDHGLSEKGKE